MSLFLTYSDKVSDPLLLVLKEAADQSLIALSVGLSLLPVGVATRVAEPVISENIDQDSRLVYYLIRKIKYVAEHKPHRCRP